VLLLDDGESTMVQEPLAALGVRSKLTQAEIGLQQVLLEQLRHRAATGLVLAWRRNRTWIGDVPFPFVAGVPDEGLRTRDLRWWQEFTWRAEQTVLALRSTFSATRTNLEPLAPEAAVQPSARDYARWLGQAQLGQRIGDAGLQAVARVTLQAANKRMLAIDGLAIGGAASVRGFAENTLIRDRGSLVNLELEIPVLRSAARNAMLQVVPFADHGRGHNIGGRTDSLGSIGVALRGRVDRFAGELAWGKRVHSTVGKERTGDSLQDHGFHLQVSYTFGGNP
jgi:hemolysin activation/secretion protein